MQIAVFEKLQFSLKSIEKTVRIGIISRMLAIREMSTTISAGGSSDKYHFCYFK